MKSWEHMLRTFTQFKLVENGGLSRSIETNHQNSHLFLSELIISIGEDGVLVLAELRQTLLGRVRAKKFSEAVRDHTWRFQ